MIKPKSKNLPQRSHGVTVTMVTWSQLTLFPCSLASFVPTSMPEMLHLFPLSIGRKRDSQGHPSHLRETGLFNSPRIRSGRSRMWRCCNVSSLVQIEPAQSDGEIQSLICHRERRSDFVFGNTRSSQWHCRALKCSEVSPPIRWQSPKSLIRV